MEGKSYKKKVNVRMIAYVYWGGVVVGAGGEIPYGLHSSVVVVQWHYDSDVHDDDGV